MVFKEHISDGTMVFGVLKIPMLKPKADVHHIIDEPNSSVQCHEENYVGKLELRWVRFSMHAMETRICMHNDTKWGDVIRYMRRR